MKPSIAPLGLELVAESVIRAGYRTVMLDLSFEKDPRAALKKALADCRPLAVGVSVRNLDDCYYASRAFLLPPVKRLVRSIKALTSAPVIVGGIGFSIAPAAALKYLGADYGVRGDGEAAFPRLLEQMAKGQKPHGLPGLVRPGLPEPTPAVVNLQDLPAPSRDRLDLYRYFRFGGQGNLETQRGCNRKCIYCADPVAKGRRLRFREPDRVADEMKTLLGRGVHTFHFCDSEFNVSRAHVEAVCRGVLRAGLGPRVAWYTYALPAPMDYELARLMASAGCKGIDFGVDAGNEAMLKNLGRDFGVDALETCARACRRAGIVFMFDLLLGGPGETKLSLADTVRRMKKIQPDRVGVSFGVRVFPGTALAARVLAAGPLAENPALHGTVKDNPDFLKSVFYVSPELGPDPESALKKMIGADPRFFFASREDLQQNYNYNNHRPLTAAIRRGARGAYWDILRRMT